MGYKAIIQYNLGFKEVDLGFGARFLGSLLLLPHNSAVISPPCFWGRLYRHWLTEMMVKQNPAMVRLIEEIKRLKREPLGSFRVLHVTVCIGTFFWSSDISGWTKGYMVCPGARHELLKRDCSTWASTCCENNEQLKHENISATGSFSQRNSG